MVQDEKCILLPRGREKQKSGSGDRHVEWGLVSLRGGVQYNGNNDSNKHEGHYLEMLVDWLLMVF